MQGFSAKAPRTLACPIGSLNVTLMLPLVGWPVAPSLGDAGGITCGWTRSAMTVTLAGGDWTLLDASFALARIVNVPSAGIDQEYDQLVVPVAACQVQPPSVLISTSATPCCRRWPCP